jgi:hypothetical protein
MIPLILIGALSENQLHPILSDARFDTALQGHPAEFCGDFTLVAVNNFQAAMGNDCSRHALLTAPCQLCANRCMPNQMFSALADERNA